MIEESGSGSGSRRLKNMWIRWIRNTADRSDSLPLANRTDAEACNRATKRADKWKNGSIFYFDAKAKKD
jgi:hypothetical protein